MHMLITGSDTAITAAEIQIDTGLTQAEEAPVEAVDPEEVNAMSASEHTVDNSMALTTMESRYNSNSAYRPATVAQLISNNPIHNAMNSGDLIEEAVNVPNGVVGFLIGRGGETISSMQARSGCKVQIQKEHELVPGQTNRVITLQAATQESIDECREMIESMVDDRIRAAGGSNTMGGSKDAKVQEALAVGHALVQVDVPDADVGLIIGKGGSTIKAIQDQTGAQVQIPPSGFSDKSDVRTVSITHPTEEGANMAKRRIEDLLNSKPSFSQQQERRSSAGPQVTVQVMVRFINI
jgi:polyribonucleotide nucleotidyltransferase